MEGERNLGVDEGFVGLRNRRYDARLHLVRGDIAKRDQGFAAVQNHHIDLPGLKGCNMSGVKWAGTVREYDTPLELPAVKTLVNGK